MATRPAGAKSPEDHKPAPPKAQKVTVTVGEGDDARELPARRVTVRGIEVTVLEEALNDFEILDDLRAAQDQNDVSRGPSLLRRIVGDQYTEILSALRGPNGRVTIEAGTEFVFDLFKALNPNS